MKLYTNWIEAKTKLDYWKAEEAKLRTKICDKILEGHGLGTQTETKGQYKIKATKKVNYSIDSEQLNFIWDDLSQEEQEAIKFTPSLMLSKYKSIDHTSLDDCITVKPAMPTLTIEIIDNGE